MTEPGRRRRPIPGRRAARALALLSLATAAGSTRLAPPPSRVLAAPVPAATPTPGGGAAPATGTLFGTVTDLVTGRPIAGVVVRAGPAVGTTDALGKYVLHPPPGTYQVRFLGHSHGGATAVDQRVDAEARRRDIALPPYAADAAGMRTAAARLKPLAAAGDTPGAPAAPAAGTQAQALAPESLTRLADGAPAVVRVLMPDGQVVAMATDDYLKGVVPAEMGYVFRRAYEALKAQAIASRTYAATRCLPDSAGDPERCEPGLDANVDTTTRTQVWQPVRYDVSDAAVDATSGQVVVTADGVLVPTLFFARAADRTRASQDSPCCGGRALDHLRSVSSPDPFARAWGHGAGMSQEGAAVLADWGATADEILAHYYSGTRVTPPMIPPRLAAAEGSIDKAVEVEPEPGAPPPARVGQADFDVRTWAPVPGGPGSAPRGRGAEGDAGAGDGGTVGAAGAPPGTRVIEGPVVETDFTFMALGARWAGQAGSDAPVTVAVRTSRDGQAWSDWTDLVDEETDGKLPTAPDLRSDGAPGDAVRADAAGAAAAASPAPMAEGWTRLLVARGRFVQVRLAWQEQVSAAADGADPATAPRVDAVTLHYFNTDAGPAAPSAPVAALRADDVPGPRVAPRAEWGADERKRFDAGGAEIWPPVYTVPRAQLVHHTVTTNDPADPAAVIRAVYQYHAVTRGWGDIGYNFLIDHRGNIYEGRHGGEVNGRITQGGHALQYNPNTIGVALLGTFTDAASRPSAAAESALVELLAARGVRYGIDPVTPVTLAGTRFAHSVMGHRDALPGHTACPGDGTYGRLAAVRGAVAVRMGELRGRPTATPVPPPTAVPPRPSATRPAAAPTALPGGCAEHVAEGGFETETAAWRRNRAAYTRYDVRTGLAAMFVGLRNDEPDTAQTFASAAQTVRLPARPGAARLAFAVRAQGDDADRRVVRILSPSGATLGLGDAVLPATGAWTPYTFDLTRVASDHAGEEVQVYFGVVNNGDGRRSYVRIDDVSLVVCAGAGTAALTPVAPPSPTAAETATPPRPTAPPTPDARTPIATAAPATATGAASATAEARRTPSSPTPPPGCTDVVGGGFEEPDLAAAGWRLTGDVEAATIEAPVQSGRRALRLGLADPGADRFGYAAAARRFHVPADAVGATVTLWLRPLVAAADDAVVVELRRPADGVRTVLLGPTPAGDPEAWTRHAFDVDLAAARGRDHEVYVAVLNRGAGMTPGAVTAVAVDDVAVRLCRPHAALVLPWVQRTAPLAGDAAYP